MKVISIQVPPAVEHRPANQLRIAGVTRFTTIDFPGFLSAVVFLKGCPLEMSLLPKSRTSVKKNSLRMKRLFLGIT